MKRNHFRLYIVLAAAVLLTVLAGSSWMGSRAQDAGNALELAWQAARESGAYHYDTTIEQTIRPLPKLENVGLSSREQRFYLEGDTDLMDHSMYLKLW
jgi:hypothetical protein